jgi:signal transduction histidine kinase
MKKSTKIAISGILGAAILEGAALAHNRGGGPMGIGYYGGGHHGGYGLGLYLCRLIAEAHGGRLSIRSQPGAGTTVKVEIPVATETP